MKVFQGSPPPAAKADAADLHAARGETEAVQIVFRPSRPLPNPGATVGAFEGPSTLPASIASIRWVAFVPVPRASGPRGGTGPHPDPLPCRPPDRIPADTNQPVWITLRVPPEARGGDYRSEVVLTADGAEVARVPLRLHVWDFVLPPTALKVTAAARAAVVPSASGAPPTEEGYRAYVRDMADHGVNALPPAILRPAEGWRAHDEEVALLRSLGVRDFPLSLGWVRHERHRWPADAHWDLGGALRTMGDPAPGAPRTLRVADAAGRDLDPAFRKTVGDLARRYAAHYRELGILDRSFVRFIDEPDLGDPRTTEWIAKVSRFLKDAAPGLRIHHTAVPVPALLPLTDVWEVHADLWTPERAPDIEAARKAGAEVWVYHNSIPLVDYPALRVRTFGWAIWKHRVQGVGAWWDLTAWRISGTDPWTDPTYGPWAGGGILLYPPRDGKERDPVDSIRWEVWRDSLEDHRLLELASALAREHPEDRDLGALLAEAEGVCPTWPGVRDLSVEPYGKDPAGLESLRRRIAAAVERLSGRGGTPAPGK